MKKINFTKAAIERLSPTDSRYEIGDTKVPSLSIRISPSATKTYQVVKKLKGKARRITLGRHPDISVEQARKKASNAISKIVYDEIDPNEEKKLEQAQTITLQEVYEDYKSSSNLTPNSESAYDIAIDRDMKDWKTKSIKNITGIMVQKRHKELSKISPSVANKTMRVLRALFNFARDQYEDAEGHSLFSDNPTRKLKRQWNHEGRRKGHIAQHQLKDWFSAVLNLPNIQKRGDPELARDYLIFLMLTGLRRREATSLTWSDIEIKARRFIVRDTKNHDELWMPLSDYLVNLLKERKKQQTKDKSKAEGPFPLEEPRKFVKIVREQSDVYFTLHDLRRTFITIAESLDIGSFTIKALVNHRSGSHDVTEGYVQINSERLRKPMQKLTDYILKASGVEESAQVLQIKTII